MFSGQIDSILSSLRTAPSAFTDSAYFVDQYDDSSFHGITDQENEWAYVTIDDPTVEVLSSEFSIAGCDGYVLVGQFKAVARLSCPFTDAQQQAFLKRLVDVDEVRITAFTTDSAFIYSDEFNQELPAPMHLMRVNFEIRSVSYISNCSENPCCNDC